MGATLCVPASAETALQYAALIHKFNPKLQQHQTHRLALEVIKDSQRSHIDARLLIALVTVESRWRQSAISSAGARGLGQLMPHTAHVLGVNPRDSKQNLLGASTYLGRMVRTFGADGKRLHLAIAAYNAGPLAVLRARGIPYNGETPEYVRRVISLWHSIRARVGDVARLPSTDKFVVGVLSVQPYDDILSVDGDQSDSQSSSESATSTAF
ncbi:MAG TPA: lytic transglycosylase domain-containing protein [Candidatus Baltobacteraceae bacterium]|jgi:soluble lytic murein transglycosylase-like protein